MEYISNMKLFIPKEHGMMVFGAYFGVHTYHTVIGGRFHEQLIQISRQHSSCFSILSNNIDDNDKRIKSITKFFMME